MNDLYQKLLAAFQVEHKDHVETVRRMLEAAERSGWADRDMDFVEAHRRMHSLKGAARAVDLNDLETLAHRLETVILFCQDGRLQLGPSLGRFLLNAMDLIEDWVAALSGGNGSQPDIARYIAEINDLLANITPETQLEISVEHPTSAPVEPAVGAKEGSDGQDENRLQPKSDSGFTPVETVRLEVSRLDDLLRCAIDVQTESLFQDQVSQSVNALCDTAEEIANLIYGRISANRGSWGGNGMDNVKSQLNTMVQQARALRLQHGDQSWRLRRVGNRLQHSVRAARMVPCEAVFGDFRRLCRDLAQSQGKRISVRCIGMDTLADRRVLQEIKDPVLHLLRNAVNHGIESPADRIAAGKAPMGLVELSVDATAGMLVINVTDDGSGINTHKVLKKAISLGLETSENDIPATPDYLLGLLTTPGISTEENVSLIAGRGMGLSIVQETITRLQGNLELDLKRSRGTGFILTVPSSIASKRVLFVTEEDQTYCIPAHQIDRLHRINPTDLSVVEGKLVFHPTASAPPLPVSSLGQLLGSDNMSSLPDTNILNLIVVKAGKQRLAIITERLSDVQDVIISDIGSTGLNDKKVAGAVTLQDGSVALVPNVSKLAENFFDRRGAAGIQPKSKDETAMRKRSVLVVDDSITTRTLEKSILEANGYNVYLSVDGVDALENLRNLQVDLVVTDIEMPRLDGFGLLKALKNHQSLSDIPVILVTSRDNPADRKRGLDLGAHSYIVKQKFDQNSLLETINQVL